MATNDKVLMLTTWTEMQETPKGSRNIYLAG